MSTELQQARDATEIMRRAWISAVEEAAAAERFIWVAAVLGILIGMVVGATLTLLCQ